MSLSLVRALTTPRRKVTGISILFSDGIVINVLNSGYYPYCLAPRTLLSASYIAIYWRMIFNSF